MATSARTGDRVLSISLSVLVHAAIVGALLWGWWQYHAPKSVPPSLAIQATVVRSAPPAAAQAAPPAPAPVDAATLAREQQQREQAQAARTAAEAAQRQAAQQEAERAAAAKAAAQEAAKAAEATRKAEQEARQAEEQAARRAQLEAERKAKEQAELKARQDAERRERLAQQLQSEQAKEQREAELRSQVQAEERLQALRSSPAMAEYQSLIAAKISRAWNRPPSARQGVHCTVHLTQIPGGEITHVSVEGCNGDDALRQSVETAAYRASPLPAPSDPALFDPNLTVTFAPDD